MLSTPTSDGVVNFMYLTFTAKLRGVTKITTVYLISCSKNILYKKTIYNFFPYNAVHIARPNQCSFSSFRPILPFHQGTALCKCHISRAD